MVKGKLKKNYNCGQLMTGINLNHDMVNEENKSKENAGDDTIKYETNCEQQIVFKVSMIWFINVIMDNTHCDIVVFLFLF